MRPNYTVVLFTSEQETDMGPFKADTGILSVAPDTDPAQPPMRRLNSKAPKIHRNKSDFTHLNIQNIAFLLHAVPQ